MNELYKAISDYIEAEKILNKCSDELGIAVQSVVRTADEEQLHDLTDLLPKKWYGVRRIYERLIIIDREKLNKE